jgi:hypothetical protein
MKDGGKIRDVQPPVDRSLEGSSSWLRVSREEATRLHESRDARRTAIARAFADARAHEPAVAPLAPEPASAVRSGRGR